MFIHALSFQEPVARVYEKGGEGIAEQVKGGAEQVPQK